MIEDREDIDYDNAIIKYMSKQHTQTLIQEMIKNNKRRLILNLDNIREFNEILARAILTIPLRVNSIFEAHLNEMAQEQAGEKIKTEKDKTLLNKKIMPYRVTFEGAFGRNMVSPRGLTSELTNQLVCVQGIVTRMSIVRPKLVYSVHYCDETKQGSIKEYYDHYATSNNTNMNGNFDGKAASYMTNSVPSKDMNGNPLTFEYGVSHFKDFQTLLVQEPPERTPVGQLPRSVEVILEEDLVDKVKPGDR